MSGPRRILIADDDAEVRELIAEYLAGRGFDVLHAANGLEALLSVKREHPQGVILNINMPCLGGLEALKRIRALTPEITWTVGPPHAPACARAWRCSRGPFLPGPFTVRLKSHGNYRIPPRWQPIKVTVLTYAVRTGERLARQVDPQPGARSE